MTSTLTEVDGLVSLVPYEEEAYEEIHAHIVNPPKNIHIWKPGMSAQDVVDIARLNGLEVVALCGYRWVPKRNPDKYPACEPCMSEAQNLMIGAGE